MRCKIMVLAAFAGTAAFVAPAHAQFYKDKTFNLLVNYAAGGNADLEARVFQQFLRKYIPGGPNIVVQNAPGAGGINAMNMLGLNIGSRADGLTLGYFTFGPISSIAEDPALKIKVEDFAVVGATKSWALAYGRKDIAPGIQKPADLAKAKNVFLGGYSRSSLHDTRLRLSMEILGVPYQMVTGFQSTSAINKAMVQNELNLSSSTLPGYTTQVIPQVIDAGVGMALFQFPVMDKDGKPVGMPASAGQNVPTFDQLYKEAFGKPPSGAKWEALLLTNHLGTQVQRLIAFPKGTPAEAVTTMRKAFQDVAKDAEFIEAFERITREKPDISPAEEVEPMLARMATVSPEIKKVLKESIAE
jgi:tripartite-type tricarboxylate transporter receptor subunit TctC